jgi:aspartate/methionine/tyrosine aminotransferase
VGALSGLRSVAPVALERWFAAQGTPPPVDMARSGAPDLTTADLLRAAGEEAIDEYLRLPLGYGDPAGTHRLRNAIVAAGHARAVDEVVVTAGAAEALLLATAAVARHGEPIAVGLPAHGGLVAAVEASGGDALPVDVWRPGTSRLDLSGLRAAIVEERVRSVVLNTPHNPTGAVACADELAGLASLCGERGGRVVVDEVAVSTLDLGARGASACPHFGGGSVVAVGDVSKSLGLGGLRIGWLTCADPELLRRVAALKDLTTLALPAPSQLLAALALEHRDRFRPHIAATARANRDHLVRWAAATEGIVLTPPADGLVAFPGVAHRHDTADLARCLRARARVGVTPGALFGVHGHVRLGLGVIPHLFAAGLDALSGALP